MHVRVRAWEPARPHRGEYLRGHTPGPRGASSHESRRGAENEGPVVTGEEEHQRNFARAATGFRFHCEPSTPRRRRPHETSGSVGD